MTDKTDFSLVQSNNRELIATSGPRRILSGMVSDSLTVASQVALPKLYRIGEYEFCELDYQQLSIWSKKSNLSLELLLHHLINPECEVESIYDMPSFRIKDGSIKSLVFNGNLIQLDSFEWQNNLKIESLAVIGRFPTWGNSMMVELKNLSIGEDDYHYTIYENPNVNIKISEISEILKTTPNLTKLCIRSLGISSINLNHTPLLEIINLSKNPISSIDVRPLQKLKHLDVSETDLYAIDLGFNVSLDELLVYCTNIEILDLQCNEKLRKINIGSKIRKILFSNTSALEELNGYLSNLTELNIKNAPALHSINLNESGELATIKLGHAPKLKELNLHSCPILKFEAGTLPSLKSLCMSGDELAEFDFNITPNLIKLEYGWKDQFEHIDISNLSLLKELEISEIRIRELNISNNKQLRKINCSGLDINCLDCTNNPDLIEIICDEGVQIIR